MHVGGTACLHALTGKREPIYTTTHTALTVSDAVGMQEGRVVEKGRHADLLANHSHYYDMWTRQLETDGTATPEDGEGVEGDQASTPVPPPHP